MPDQHTPRMLAEFDPKLRLIGGEIRTADLGDPHILALASSKCVDCRQPLGVGIYIIDFDADVIDTRDMDISHYTCPEIDGSPEVCRGK